MVNNYTKLIKCPTKSTGQRDRQEKKPHRYWERHRAGRKRTRDRGKEGEKKKGRGEAEEF